MAYSMCEIVYKTKQNYLKNIDSEQPAAKQVLKICFCRRIILKKNINTRVMRCKLYIN